MGVTTNRRRAAGHSGGGGADYSQMYFTIESQEDGNVVSIRNKNCNTLPTFYYSTDNGQTWSSITAVKSRTQSVVTIDSGETVLFKCTQAALSLNWNSYNGFQCSKNYIVYGNAMSLIWGDNFVSNSEFTSGTTNNLVGLFQDDTHVTDASNLILPAMTVLYNGYNGMFWGCTNLRKAPKLPATNFTIGGSQGNGDNYSSMFEGCINLEEAPELPATTLCGKCYNGMFRMDPNNRITTPKMTKSPVLPASVVPREAYQEMFKGNGNLVEVTCLATNISASRAVNNWLTNCSTTGTFKKAASMSSWPSSASGIPSGWTVEDYVET